MQFSSQRSPRRSSLPFLVQSIVIIALVSPFAARPAAGAPQEATHAAESSTLLGEVAMIVSYSAGSERRRVTHDKVMEPAGLLINQAVTVTLELAPQRAGETIGVTPLDGGRVVLHGNGVVGRDGKASFTFQAGRLPGSYRLIVGGLDRYLIEFWAVDPNAQRPPSRARNH